MPKPGVLAWVSLANAAGAAQVLTPYIDDAEVSQPMEMIEVSAFGTLSKAFVAGLAGGGNFPVSGPLESTLYSHFGALYAAHSAGSAASAFIFAPMGSVATYPKTSGTVLVQNFTTKSTVGGRAEWSAQLQITGAVTNAVW